MPPMAVIVKFIDRLSDTLPPVLRNRILFGFELLLFFVSVVTLAAIVVDYGFVLDDVERRAVADVYAVAWWVYFIMFIVRLVFYHRYIKGKTLLLTLFLGVNMFLSALPKIFLLADAPRWMQFLWRFLDSKFYLIALLTLFSVLEVSRGVVAFINKRTNPALLMAACFAVIIALGTILLLVPRSTHEWIRLSVVDALFVATSAVCVTGLSSVDVAHTFSFEGLCVILLLMQIGGLGVMTITSFFALFFMGGAGFYNQFALRDMVGTDAMNSLISTLLYIMGFTFVIELIGALAIWLSVRGTLGMGLYQEMFFALFHSVSAFCNAGFSTLSGNLGNSLVVAGHNMFFIIISLLVVLGGIGFPILVNFKELLAYHLRRFYDAVLARDGVGHKMTHVANLNTKIVLAATALLLSVGTLFIAVAEWEGAFAGMPVADKVVQSLFNAVAPRTAGFNSVELTAFSLPVLLLYTFFMWIGGASQSTAGGIKVNTLAVAVANLLAVVKGKGVATLFRREISEGSVRRALAVVFGSLVVVFTSVLLLVMLEPRISLKGLLFEAVSAYSTVGASLGVTPLLCAKGKIVVTLLMFIGRVGLITVLMGFVRRGGVARYRLPMDDVIIN